MGQLPTTTIVIGLLVVGYVGLLIPSVDALVSALPPLALYLVSAIDPGGFLNLVLDGFFVYMMGMQVEYLLRPWQYIATFIVSGAFGAFAAALTGMGFIGTMAPFGLGGVLAYSMATHGLMARNQVFTWVIVLLVVNFVLSGFSLPLFLGMVGAFIAGVALTAIFSQT